MKSVHASYKRGGKWAEHTGKALEKGPSNLEAKKGNGKDDADAAKVVGVDCVVAQLASAVVGLLHLLGLVLLFTRRGARLRRGLLGRDGGISFSRDAGLDKRLRVAVAVLELLVGAHLSYATISVEGDDNVRRRKEFGCEVSVAVDVHGNEVFTRLCGEQDSRAASAKKTIRSKYVAKDLEGGFIVEAAEYIVENCHVRVKIEGSCHGLELQVSVQN